MVERRKGGKFNRRSRSEIIVRWSARVVSLNEEVEWRPLYGGAPGEEIDLKNRMETIVNNGRDD